MLFLSAEGWTLGIMTTIYVFWGWFWGLFLIYQGKKTSAKLLTLWGIYTFLLHTALTEVLIDFLSILITGNNVSIFLHILTSGIWIGLSGLFALWVLTELLAPKYKWYFLSWWIITQTFWELSLLLNFSGYIYISPSSPGEELIYVLLMGPSGNLMSLGLNRFIFLGGFGLIYKGIQSRGVMRKKYVYIAMTLFLYNVPTFLYTILNIPTYIRLIVFIVQFFAIFFAYLGLRKEPEKRKKRIKKDVKVKDSLFRITKRPDQITEEEVTYYREQKICLICKGKVGGFNTYICMNCEALYHEECARTLSDLENACWVCNQPIDETKPTKPFKIVEEKMTGEILMKEEKNSKTEKINSHKEG